MSRDDATNVKIKSHPAYAGCDFKYCAFARDIYKLIRLVISLFFCGEFNLI